MEKREACECQISRSEEGVCPLAFAMVRALSDRSASTRLISRHGEVDRTALIAHSRRRVLSENGKKGCVVDTRRRRTTN